MTFKLTMKKTYHQILWFAAILVVALVIFEFTSVDLTVQDQFYDFTSQRWVVDKNDPVPRFFFYQLPRYLFAGLLILLIASLICPPTWGNRFRLERRKTLFLLLCLVLIPSLIGLGKKISGVYCPSEIIRYGGARPYIQLFESLPPEVAAQGCGHCFPAGHASGAFALMALFFALNRQRWKWLGLTLGLTLGWILGLYQMMKGCTI